MNEESSYHISKPARQKIRIQRSSFTGSIDSASDSQQAENFVGQIRQEFFKAAHNCFAYRINKSQFRFSDDGEPSGTAGRPILTALEKYNLEQTVLVITRFFGGIKLGKGGLLRAYSQCAEETILKAGMNEFIPQKNVRIVYPYGFTNNMESLIKRHSGNVVASDFQTEVSADIQIPEKFYDKFINEVLNLGGSQIEVLEE